MFKKVVVGVDGETGGRDAIALALALVDPDGELIEAHVRLIYPSKFTVVSPDARSWPEDDIPHGKVKHVSLRRVTARSVARGLHELVEREEAGLLVIGSTRHGAFGRVLIGDDTRAAINGAPCAIAIAPTGYASRAADMRHVGVGYDGSPESVHAVDVARSIASDHDARLSAIEVVNFPTHVYLEGAGIPVEEFTRPLLDDAREQLESLGDVETVTKFGATGEELAHYSGSLGMLVVGSRSYGPVGRLVHSSTSRYLARNCHCPLLVMPRHADASELAERA